MSKSIAFVLCVLAISAPVSAQVASAELSGTILDPTGAAVANAKVTATNVTTNRPLSTVRDATGKDVIPLLPPGEYPVNVEASGFRRMVQKGLTLQINQQASL